MLPSVSHGPPAPPPPRVTVYIPGPRLVNVPVTKPPAPPPPTVVCAADPPPPAKTIYSTVQGDTLTLKVPGDDNVLILYPLLDVVSNVPPVALN